ncbi:MAG: hypothetical protein ABR498_01950, partial [Candidatus Dormibacteria bacterium]
MTRRLAASYVLPIRSETPPDAAIQELAAYVYDVCAWVDEVLVVDGSPPDVYAAHAALLPAIVRHLAPETTSVMGKV